MITDYFNLAFRNVRKRKLRAWLTMLGIIISIATIFILISVSLGLRGAIEEQFRILGTDKFFIQPQGQLAGPGTAGAVTMTERDIEVIEKVNGVKDVSYVLFQPVKVEIDEESRYFNVLGIPADHAQVYTEIAAYKADEGRLITFEKTGEVMLGSHYKYNNLYRKPVKAGDTILVNDQEFEVKTILQPIGNPGDDRLIYMSLDDFHILFPERESIDQIIVQVSAGENLSEVADRTDRRLRSFRNVDKETQDYTILTPEELLSSFGTVLNILTAFLSGVAAISLLVGGIGIANTMYTSVLERTKEIGTMKAIGAKNKDILLVFLIESGFLGLLGGLIGVLFGIVVAKTIEYIAIKQLGTTLLQAATPFSLIAGCLAFSFLAGAISGILPAYRASKVKVVDALRYE